MTPENFCYWLQGFFEIKNPPFLGVQETEIVKDHLALVFKKVTPQYYPLDNNQCDNKHDQQNAEWKPMFFTDGNAPLPTGTKTNLYFGGESSFSINPSMVQHSC